MRSVMQPGECGQGEAVLSEGREGATHVSAGFWLVRGPVLALGSLPHHQRCAGHPSFLLTQTH